MSSSLQVTDAESAAVATHPRVQLSDIEAGVSQEYSFTARRALDGMQLPSAVSANDDPLAILTVCILVMKNGFTVIGKSAPASPENYNAALGAKFAREDAIRQLWPLMGYALRDKLHNSKT